MNKESKNLRSFQKEMDQHGIPMEMINRFFLRKKPAEISHGHESNNFQEGFTDFKKYAGPHCGILSVFTGKLDKGRICILKEEALNIEIKSIRFTLLNKIITKFIKSISKLAIICDNKRNESHIREGISFHNILIHHYLISGKHRVSCIDKDSYVPVPVQ